MKDDSTKAVSVLLLNKEYLVGCPVDEQDALRHAAQHLDQKMREIRASGKTMGLDRIAVMAALNLAHELLQQRAAPNGSDTVNAGKSGKRSGTALDAQLNALGERIEETLQRVGRTDV